MLSVNNSADSLNSGEGLNTATTQVLVVEDEELIRETLVLALSEEGYDVIAATDGHQALDLINTRLLQTNLRNNFV